MFHHDWIMVQLQQPLLCSGNDRIKHKPATLLFRYFDFYSITYQSKNVCLIFFL